MRQKLNSIANICFAIIIAFVIAYALALMLGYASWRDTITVLQLLGFHAN